jgi:type I restriction enzyme S subunit
MDYLLLYLQNEQHSMKKKASGGVQSFVSLGFLRNYLLPLPPLAEQKRIVAKLEEILPLCDRLK